MTYNEFLHSKIEVAPVSGFKVRPEEDVLSGEELERFINHFNICDIRTSEECKMSCCEVCVMDWLQQPAEGPLDGRIPMMEV